MCMSELVWEHVHVCVRLRIWICMYAHVRAHVRVVFRSTILSSPRSHVTTTR